MMDKKNIFLTRFDSVKFKKHTLVKFITCIGDNYMVADLNDNSIREYIWYSDIYPIDWSPQNFRANYKFNTELQQIADGLLN